MQRQRISRELARLTSAPPQGICVFQKDDKLDVLEVKITGPKGSPYDNGLFTLEVLMPENYPFAPPSMKFLTRVYHPNIDENGRICLDLIKMPPAGSWKPTISLEGLLIAIRMLLESPNVDDPLRHELAEEYKSNKEEFVRKARLLTKKYAK